MVGECRVNGMDESQGDLPFFAGYQEAVYVAFVPGAVEVGSGEGESKAFWTESNRVEVTDLTICVCQQFLVLI